MTWTAPQITRPDPPYSGDERTQLDAWLEFHRQTLLTKCAGLTPEQLALRSVEPSSMSLLGLVRHMTEVERAWFRRRFGSEQLDMVYSTEADLDRDFDGADAAGAERDLEFYTREVEAARAVAAGRSLEDTFVHPRLQVEVDLRWVYLHMIEEYARHNGHADLLRERIDGATGD